MKLLRSAAGVAACCTLIAHAALAADSYPAKPIRVIVGQAPGGAVDIISRGLAQKLTEGMGYPVIVDNRSGAAGSIAAALVAGAAPDGYTVLFVSSTFSIIPALYDKLQYDPAKDLQPVTLIASSPFLLLVHPSVPARSVKDFIALAKAKPKMLNYGSGGIGSSGHLAAVLFSTLAGVDLTHVPYKGAGPALIDVVGGQLQLTFASIVSGLPFATSGKLIALGITTARRSAAAPDLATIAESGLPGYDFSSWYGLLLPEKAPRTISTRLNAEVRRALAQPDFKERLAKDGSEPVGSTPAEFGTFLRNEMTKWAKIVKSAGIKGE
jgi:tripartite-type tricarboxylate transporter receptor subunit TctC